jgi:protocatechuate 3,4-dioxygenase beta subunit
MRTALILASMAMGIVVSGQSLKPVRNPIPPGKGVIAGRVIDAASKRPIAGARVRLQPRGRYAVWAPGIEADPSKQVTTGAAGEFRFSDLGPVEYDLTSSRPGYIEGGAGKTWARGSHAPVLLEQDQSITALDILMWPVGELTGRVVDERGMPVAGVQVQAREEEFTTGSGQFSRHFGSGTTDDRGEYRFPVQPPGRVIVCIDAMYSSFAIPPLSPGQRRMADAPAIGMSGEGPSMLISPDGRHLVLFSLLPPPSRSSGESEAYVKTCAPAATSSAEATVIELKGGTTAAPDLSLRPQRAVRVSGRLLGHGGPLGQKRLGVVRAAEGRAGRGGAQGVTGADGPF